MGAEPVAVGIDLGTSGVKLVAVTPDGRIAGRSARAYPTHRPTPDAAEQDVADWLSALDQAAAELAVDVEPTRWSAFALSAMLPTLVALDASGRPVGPAITWEDARAEADAERLLEGLDTAQLYRQTGQRVDGRYLLPMAARLARIGHQPAVIAGAKDFLFHFLTGCLLTDPSTAAGYGNWLLAEQQWADLPARVAALPEVRPSDHTEPLVTAVAQRWGCRPGVPVMLGAADSVLGAYGLGVHEPGPVAAVLGTSAVLIAESDGPTVDPAGVAIVTPTATGGFAREIDLLTLGSAIGWLGGLFGLDAPRLMQLASTARVEQAPLVLPYLAPGEQGIRWDPNLFGSIGGLSLRTGRAELALGLVAGLVHELSRGVEVLSPDGEILAGGSVASNRFFRQQLADATGRIVRFDPDGKDSSTIGAARLAAAHVLGGSTDPVVERDATLPDVAARALWTQRAAEHEAELERRRP